MAVYAQTACTLSTITDVTAVYTYYYLSSSTITNNMAPKDNVNPPDETHSAGSRQVTVTYGGNSYVWKDIDPNINISDGDAVGLLYYIECVKFSDGTYDWGPLMTSSAYAAAKAAYNLSSQALGTATEASNAIALLGGHFTYNGFTATTLTPHSANVIEYVSTSPASWKHNVHIGSTGIALRYNETTLSKWYVDNNNNTTIQLGKDSNQRFIINTSSIQAYNSSNQKYFEVNANGLTYGTGNTAVASQTELNNEINARKAKYGTCETTYSYRDKTVTCANFELVAGNEITIYFNNTNGTAGNSQTSSSVRLNINNQGAKEVWVANAATSSTNQLLWGNGAYITFRYDGSKFIVIGEPRAWYGSSDTAVGTTPKTDSVTAVTGCVICKGTTVNMQMANVNTASNPKLNIQSTGAKLIYAGSNVSDSTTSWSANSTVPFVFDGQFWKYDIDAISKANAAQTKANEADSKAETASYSVEIGVTNIDYTKPDIDTSNPVTVATLVAVPYYQGTITIPSGVTLTYQWYRDSVGSGNLVGTGATLNVTNASTMGLDHSYICVISK